VPEVVRGELFLTILFLLLFKNAGNVVPADSTEHIAISNISSQIIFFFCSHIFALNPSIPNKIINHD
jgi:hypothetical protein